MKVSHTYLRNLLATLLVLAIVLAFAEHIRPAAASPPAAPAVAPPHQAVDFSWSPVSGTINVQPGGAPVLFSSTLTNRGLDENFIIDVTGLPAGWTLDIAPSDNVFIESNRSQAFSFFVSAPANADPNTTITLRITAARESSPSVTSLLLLTVDVVAPTATPTITNTPTATVGPSPTPGPICVGGRDAYDPVDDERNNATLILVNAAQEHGICSVGDEDWYQFGAIGGKVYTIDVPEMDAGLDLIIELYDPQGNLILTNDDFFARDPTNPFDLRPRVDSWTAPYDGIFYFRIRDTLNLGGESDDRTYIVVVLGESYGPTPVTIPQICRDLYEEDGLPEEATLITSNEVQPTHILCPDGDADWVRFFGKAGKTYYLYTDTRPYRNNPDINNQTEAGADTVLYLFDRDGVTLITFNDDIAGSLDSEVRFTPSVDGFYYAQIKNVGDIGNQFIRYDLVLKLCLPGEECGRSPVSTLPSDDTNGFTPGATSTPTRSPTTTPTEAFFLDETPTPENGDDSAFSFDPSDPSTMVNGPVEGFVDRAFELVWQRSDLPVAGQRAARSWIWGPRGPVARSEIYGPDGNSMRQVQYFDKARMEINDPAGDRSNPWFVTTGLLVAEMVTGRMQIGAARFVERGPATVPIAGDRDDPNGPTYASFAAVTGPAGDRSGQIPSETIDRAGRVGAYTGPQRPETRLIRFVPETGHNIPEVFWEYLNGRGVIYTGGEYSSGTIFNWVFTVGYPISEPYWARVRVGGQERDVLVQAFERRVLTYTPENPEGWRVEMGNVGRHYYFWRYGEELPS